MIRGIGLRGAIAVNVITMIGIGPLITIPLVLNQLHGSLALAAWIAGALIALCDGLIWAELGSRYPGSGGTYVFLREAFGRERLGRMLAFLFTWQTVLSIPLLLASGYIGFAHYAAYLWPPLSAPMLQGVVAAAVALVTVVLLYRPIGNIAKTSVVFGIVAIATLLVVILASASHFAPAQAVAFDRHAPVASALLAGLGPALVITLYDYYGYGQVCFVGDEVHDGLFPWRSLRRLRSSAASTSCCRSACSAPFPGRRSLPRRRTERPHRRPIMSLRTSSNWVGACGRRAPPRSRFS